MIAASSFEQARIAFEHVVAFMGDKLDDRQPVESLGHRPTSANRRRGTTGARVRRIGSDPATGARPGAGA